MKPNKQIVGILLIFLASQLSVTADDFTDSLIYDLLQAGWQENMVQELRSELNDLDWTGTDYASSEASALGLRYIIENNHDLSARDSAMIARELARASSTMRKAGFSSRDAAISTMLGARKVSDLLAFSTSTDQQNLPEAVQAELQQSAIAQDRLVSRNRIPSRVEQMLSTIPAPVPVNPGADIPGNGDLPERP